MKNPKIKLVVFIVFLLLVIGGGYGLSTLIGRNSIKKTGFKTEHNPNYIDSMVRAKKGH
ncbi:MAG: hypothetical protein IT244_08345 [Bacteroidia bacterium]|nr:hypothetical protein [Bacteroidia bacterium]